MFDGEKPFLWQELRHYDNTYNDFYSDLTYNAKTYNTYNTYNT